MRRGAAARDKTGRGQARRSALRKARRLGSPSPIRRTPRSGGSSRAWRVSLPSLRACGLSRRQGGGQNPSRRTAQSNGRANARPNKRLFASSGLKPRARLKPRQGSIAPRPREDFFLPRRRSAKGVGDGLKLKRRKERMSPNESVSDRLKPWGSIRLRAKPNRSPAPQSAAFYHIGEGATTF